MKVTQILKKLHIPIPDNKLVEEIFRISSENTSERLIEIPLVLNAIPHKLSRILDIGCRYSLMPLQLASVGHEMHGMDIHPYDKKHPNLQFHEESILDTTLPKNYFDVVISLSTIEHIGMDAYAGVKDGDGDKRAIEQARRLLKKNGIFIFTAPFGKAKDGGWYRVYNTKRLQSVLEGFTLKELRVFRMKNKKWIPTTVQQGEKIDCSSEITCAFFLTAVKK